MKSLIRFAKLFFLVSVMATPGVCFSHAQKADNTERSVVDLLSSLPTDLEFKGTVPLKYRVTSIFHNRGIGGDIRSKVRLTAYFTRSVEDGDVNCRWNNVQVSAPSDPADPFPLGTLLNYMEDFGYPLSEDIMSERLYRHIPNGDLKHLLKTLVWDAATLEPVFWDHFDEFQLNQDYIVPNFEDITIAMGNWGALRMRDLKMRWMGISEVNDEVCALLLYRSLANPVQYGAMTGTNGRSLYWGNIWVSLADKQVEYFTMIEDVFLEMPMPGESAKRVMNLQRETTFEHVP